MIFKTNLLIKEFRYAYYENTNSLRTSLALGVFQGMFAFAIYFVLQSLSRSVLSDVISVYMQPSYFSTLHIYLAVSYITLTAYLALKYQDITYCEVYENSWYSLLHLGYGAHRMVLSKMAAQFAKMLFIFTAGFLSTVALASFLKFPFVPAYFLSLYLCGAMHALMLLSLAMALSISMRDIHSGKYLVCLGSVLLFFLQFPSGYYRVFTDRTAMRDVGAAFLPGFGSWYATFALLMVAACAFYTGLKSAWVAGLFNPPFPREAPALTARQGEGTTVIVRTDSRIRRIRQSKRQLEASYKPKRQSAVLSALVTAALSLLIAGMLLINGAILMFNYASPEKETSFMGFIPYIFASATMEPTIHYNDIAFFESVDQYVEIDVGDVVLFKDAARIVQVRRVKEMRVNQETGGIVLGLDIDNYPDDAIPDVMKTEADVSAVYGRLVGVNRYIGAVALFANTVLGRILFLLVPAVLVFYAGKIRAIFSREKNRPARD